MGGFSNQDEALASAMAPAKKPNFVFFVPGLPDGKLDSIDLSKYENLIVVDATKFAQDPRKTLKAYQAAVNPPKVNEGKKAEPAAVTVSDAPAASDTVAVAPAGSAFPPPPAPLVETPASPA